MTNLHKKMPITATATYVGSAFEHPLSRFSDDVSKNWSPPTSKSLRFVGREQFEHHQQIASDGTSIKSLIGSVRISDLCEFLRSDDISFIDERLFHANVRGHLGLQNPVNREIAETLRDTGRDFFFFLNNGVTIVCDKYLYQSGGLPPIGSFDLSVQGTISVRLLRERSASAPFSRNNFASNLHQRSRFRSKTLYHFGAAIGILRFSPFALTSHISLYSLQRLGGWSP
jgi:AIPR protein